MHYAAEQGHVEILKMLAKCDRSDMNCTNNVRLNELCTRELFCLSHHLYILSILKVYFITTAVVE